MRVLLAKSAWHSRIDQSQLGSLVPELHEGTPVLALLRRRAVPPEDTAQLGPSNEPIQRTWRRGENVRKAFAGYYRPAKEELAAMWNVSLFAFGANVLLNVYVIGEYMARTL